MVNVVIDGEVLEVLNEEECKVIDHGDNVELVCGHSRFVLKRGEDYMGTVMRVVNTVLNKTERMIKGL